MSEYYQEQQYSFATDRITWAVQRLIFITTAIFVVQLLVDIPFGAGFSVPGGMIAEWFAFQPVALLRGAVWKPFTYIFLHGGLLHLFLNMLWLFFFGPEVERGLGTRQFVRFYIACGALGVLATFVPMLIHGDLMSVTGSSGAIMGVMVAYAMLNPDRQFFLFPLPIPITARALVIILIAMNLISAAQGGNTSVATHLGGMAVGFAYMRLIPVFRRWQRARWQAHEPRPNHWRSRGWPFKAAAKKDPLDATGEAVDNIFKFEDRKNRP